MRIQEVREFKKQEAGGKRQEGQIQKAGGNKQELRNKKEGSELGWKDEVNRAFVGAAAYSRPQTLEAFPVFNRFKKQEAGGAKPFRGGSGVPTRRLTDNGTVTGLAYKERTGPCAPVI